MTAVQKNSLNNKSNNTHLIEYSLERKTKARNERIFNQEIGKLKAKEKDLLHCMGCMLYWAEGTKNKNTLSFTNMDINMHKLFLKFLRERFSVSDSKISLYINSFITNQNDWNKIKNYWLTELKLPESCIRKPALKITNELKNMGVCKLVVGDTQLVQHIYGAIQEYAGFNNEYCIDRK